MGKERVRLTERDALAVMVAIEGNRKLGRTSPDWMEKAYAQIQQTGEQWGVLVVNDVNVEAMYEPIVRRDPLGRQLNG